MPDTILDTALSKITGAPAGGDVSSAGTAPPGTASVADLAPKQSFADFLISYATQAQASNAQPGFKSPEQVQQEASLASAQAATAAAQQQLAALGQNPWDKPAVAASISKGFFYDPTSGQVQVGGMWGAPDKMTVVNPTNINDPGIYHTMDWAIGERNKTGFSAANKDPGTLAAMKIYEMASPAAKQQAFNEYGKYYYSAPGAYEAGGKPAAQGGQSAAMAATGQRLASQPSAAGGAPPVRPTARNITWQQDQQYWRDMDAYNKANKLGAYR